MKRNFTIIALIICLVVVAYWFMGDSQPALKPLPKDATILAFGDSLTRGKGATLDQSYPALLQKLTGYKVINAGLNGETTAEGLERLPTALGQYHPQLLLLGLGGNDMLQKVSAQQIKANLAQMLQIAKDAGVPVVLIAAPQPNIALSVPELYDEVAEFYNVPLEKDLLSDLLKSPQYKSDAAHLNAAGYQAMAEGIAAFLHERGAIHNTLRAK
ncbi:MAG: arylesterase [Legionellales bacterium]|nr:arylesterase [Legionellales bacterium]|tara:strand:+ start:2008 stop:2649 length:642 start_codon:yes stop_codon:yes gene_type:complete